MVHPRSAAGLALLALACSSTSVNESSGGGGTDAGGDASVGGSTGGGGASGGSAGVGGSGGTSLDGSAGTGTGGAAGSDAGAPTGSVDCGGSSCEVTTNECCYQSVTSNGACQSVPTPCDKTAIRCQSSANCKPGEVCCYQHLGGSVVTVECVPAEMCAVGPSVAQLCAAGTANECKKGSCKPKFLMALPDGYFTCQ